MGQSPTLGLSLVERLHEQSGAARWGLSVEALHATLEASVAHAFSGTQASARDVDRYVASLHIADLALASACAAGLELAWNHFIADQRPALYRAADAIDPTGGTRELADALYGELFGLQQRDGVRQSLFRYFHGRSSLATWLRAVLAQRHIDRVRAGRRLEPLPDEEIRLPARAAETVADPERPRFVAAMRVALAAAVGALAPRDRLRLACYYAQDMTLAAIGRLLGEHEATVSRHLTRTRREIRQRVERCLRDEHGLDGPSLAQCLQSVAGDAGSLDLAEIIGPPPQVQEREAGSFK